MSVNDLDHVYCKVCGRRMTYVSQEKAHRKGRVTTLFFYACESRNPKHDRAVYEEEVAGDNE